MKARNIITLTEDDFTEHGFKVPDDEKADEFARQLRDYYDPEFGEVFCDIANSLGIENTGSEDKDPA